MLYGLIVLIHTLSFSMEMEADGEQIRLPQYAKIFARLKAIEENRVNDFYLSSALSGYMVYRYDGQKFIHLTNLFKRAELNSLPKQDLDDLVYSNYITLNYFRLLKVNDQFKRMGAIIIGSQNKELIGKLRMLDLKSKC